MHRIFERPAICHDGIRTGLRDSPENRLSVSVLRMLPAASKGRPLLTIRPPPLKSVAQVNLTVKRRSNFGLNSALSAKRKPKGGHLGIAAPQIAHRDRELLRVLRQRGCAARFSRRHLRGRCRKATERGIRL